MQHHAPATQRNREPILEVLLQVLPKSGTILEIASGTGEQHYPRNSQWDWRTRNIFCPAPHVS